MTVRYVIVVVVVDASEAAIATATPNTWPLAGPHPDIVVQHRPTHPFNAGASLQLAFMSLPLHNASQTKALTPPVALHTHTHKRWCPAGPCCPVLRAHIRIWWRVPGLCGPAIGQSRWQSCLAACAPGMAPLKIARPSIHPSIHLLCPAGRTVERHGNRMLISVSCAEALAWARAHLQEGTGSSPFTGQSEAERAPSTTAGPQTHAGLPL